MYQSIKKGDRKLIGVVPVGTGTICIGDPMYVLDTANLPEHLQSIVSAVEKGEYGTVYQRKVLVSTGMDGRFPIYAEYENEGDFEPSRYIIELTEST